MIAETEVTELRRQLEQARLRADVAVDLIPLIDEMVDDHDVRMVVVNDVTACWLLLPATVRAGYAKPRYDVKPRRSDGPDRLPVSWFVHDYVNEVDRAWKAASPPASTLTNTEREEWHLTGWYDFVAGICERTAAGEPPPAQWLARFPAVDNDEAASDGPDDEG